VTGCGNGRRGVGAAALRSWIASILLAACAAAWLAAVPAAAEGASYDFDVPPGTADVVVSAIADASGDFILYRYDALRAVQSNGVVGRYTALEALNQALAGTGYTARVAPGGAIVVDTAQPEARAEPEPRSAERRERAREVEPAPPPELLTVTGTRIRRSGMTTPVPVTVVSTQEMERLSPTTLISGIDQLPQFVNNATPEYAVGSSGSVGQSLLNLRGIGSNRTLILLDGRRVVASTRRGTTDIGILPEGLVRDVDIITGGASATYGSDAVAGVVNFRLDTEFEGLRGHLQSGMSERGDYQHGELSLAAGFRLDERTHLLLAADAYRNEGVDDLSDREWHHSWGLVRGVGAGAPRFIIAPNVVASSYSYGGLIPSGPLKGTKFLPNGEPAPFDYGTFSGSGTQIGGDGVDVAKERTLVPASERQSGFAYLSRELNPKLTAYLQALYGHTRAEYDKDPNYMSGLWAGTVYIDNAYLPDSIRQRMTAAGIESFPFSRYASPRDLSTGRIDSENNTYSLAAGVTGEVGDWRLDAYYQYGSNRQEVWLRDVVRVDRIYQALDSVRDPSSGAIVCRSTLTFPDNGCTPTSFFGDGAVSREARAWILDDTSVVQELLQHVADVAVDGEPFDLWAGPVSVAVGGSWRYDQYDQYGYPYTRDMITPTAAEAGYKGLPEAYSGGAPLLERAVGFVSHGKANVWELYSETIAPLARDLPFADAVDLQAALRYADYEGSGGIWAWKAGLNWLMTPDLRLRGTISRDIRAGTLAERYEVSGRAAAARDPTIDGEPVYSFVGIENGNPNVAPEKADAFTVGAVYRPSWLPGFSASADYYDIRIKDAIAQLGVQSIVDLCFEGDASLCDLIHRGESGYILSVRNTFLNVDAARTRGIDIELDYETPISLFGGNETFALRGLASIYSEASLTPYGLPRRDLVGQTGPGEGLPDYRLLLGASYERGEFSADLIGSYISSGVYNLAYVEGVDITDNTVDSALYTHARIAYDFATPRGTWQVYFNVNNLFDQVPPIAPTAGGGVFGSTQAPPDFDSVGRRYAVGLRWTY
jgi:outer membrane receptor protein involved in Fe transport